MTSKDSPCNTHTCSSWTHYTHYIEQHFSKRNTTIYRGHANPDWQLITPFHRTIDLLNSITPLLTITGSPDPAQDPFSNILQNAFEDYAIGHPNYPTTPIPPPPSPHPSDKDLHFKETLHRRALGRHHGLHTPLLDWTYSPHIAAYFAYYELLQTQLQKTPPDLPPFLTIWALEEPQNLPRHTDGQIFHYASRTAHLYRQKAQQGSFTYLKDTLDTNILSILQTHDYTASLQRTNIQITNLTDIINALTQLNLMNINHATLFPDLEGYAIQANTHYILWHYHQSPDIPENPDTIDIPPKNIP